MPKPHSRHCIYCGNLVTEPMNSDQCCRLKVIGCMRVATVSNRPTAAGRCLSHVAAKRPFAIGGKDLIADLDALGVIDLLGSSRVKVIEHSSHDV